ncbi:MAG: cupin domain-containing protein [Candidatus Eremiobacteraeota bacterium]|nr:cupin domain-containing protein [Candidatus Eremiobacteraeota bacterium]MBC5828055.1 cupin domain-containing protein [Candidatus Eremiobacteraeota bacterium]
MQKTAIDGISFWSRWQADRGVYFNSWLVEQAAGAFIVDPLEPDDDAVLSHLRTAGVRAIVVTNRDHARAAARFGRELNAPIIASEPDAPLLSLGADRVVRDGDDIFGWRVMVLDGYKTAGEMVLYSKALRTAICGDAFWGAPAGALSLMSDEKLIDPVRALLSARRLRALQPVNLLVGDGAPVFGNAAAAIGALIDGRAAEAPASILNIDELDWRDFPGEPAPFTADNAEIGLVLGAERLGVAAARLRPGESYCPLHWHTREEEFFVVWDGSPTIRTPAATRVLRRGDCIVFQTNPSGAHRLCNESDAPCTLLLIANIDAGDVCSYPDSNKHVVEATGVLVRDAPQLDYYDSE